MDLRRVRAGFVGFGEVNSPQELIRDKVWTARQALEERDMEMVATDEPVTDDPQRRDEKRAIRDL